MMARKEDHHHRHHLRALAARAVTDSLRAAAPRAATPAERAERAARFEDCVRSLEAEKAKMDVFRRELPISVHLVADGAYPGPRQPRSTIKGRSFGSACSVLARSDRVAQGGARAAPPPGPGPGAGALRAGGDGSGGGEEEGGAGGGSRQGGGRRQRQAELDELRAALELRQPRRQHRRHQWGRRRRQARPQGRRMEQTTEEIVYFLRNVILLEKLSGCIV